MNDGASIIFYRWQILEGVNELPQENYSILLWKLIKEMKKKKKNPGDFQRKKKE